MLKNSTVKSNKAKSWQDRFKENMEKKKGKIPFEILDWYEKQVRQPVSQSLDEIETPVGQVMVIPNRCKECDYCIVYCPEEVLTKSDNMNDKGYYYPTTVADKVCVVCNFCQEICPDFAIFTEEIKKTDQENTKI